MLANFENTNVKIFDDCADEYTQPDFSLTNYSIVKKLDHIETCKMWSHNVMRGLVIEAVLFLLYVCSHWIYDLVIKLNKRVRDGLEQRRQRKQQEEEKEARPKVMEKKLS